MKKNVINNVIGGMFVGIANIIPGVSGGTMLVIFNLFDKLMYSIEDIFKKKTKTRKNSIMTVMQVLIGAALGIILFAKLIGISLKYIEAETIFCFMGLILFSVPLIIKEEMKNEKFNIISFIIGFGFIVFLQYMNIKGGHSSSNASLNFIHFISMILYGMIGGATMIFPGVSGSMILLVLGKYEMIRSYIDNLTKFDIDSIISLSFLGIGIILGIILSAKLTTYLLNNHKGKTVSVILGFIIASALTLPFNIENSFVLSTAKICSLIISFTLGGAIIYYINLLQNKKNN